MRLLGKLFVLVCVCASSGHADWAANLQRQCASAVTVLADSGIPIREYNADEIRAPASMVKLMQMLMVAEGLREERWALDDVITVSKYAASIGGARVNLKEGEERTLAELLAAISVVSANDAAMAIAEGLWGSKEAYLKAMNARAKELGMASSEFNSVNGLPPGPGEQPDRTNARDIALLARQCIQEPLVMEWAGQRELTFREGEAARSNTNRLLGRMEDVDGLKTGFTRAAGWCLAATAERNGIRLVSVLMGCATIDLRFSMTEALLEEGFRETERIRVLARGERVEPDMIVQNCETSRTRLALAEDVWVTIPKHRKADLALLTETPAVLHPPLDAGESLGKLRLALGEVVLAETDLILTEPLRPASLRWKMARTIAER